MDNKVKKNDIRTYIFPDIQEHANTDNNLNNMYSLDEMLNQNLTGSKENPLINTLKVNKYFSSLEKGLTSEKSTEPLQLLNIIRDSYMENGILGVQHALADIRNKILEENQK